MQQDVDYSNKVIHEYAEQHLLTISDALESGDERGPFGTLVKATKEKTNTKGQRETRIRWLANALTQSL